MADQIDENRQNGSADGGADDKGFKPFTEADVDAAFVAGDMDKLKEIAAWGAKTTPGLYKRAKDAEGKLKDKPDADDDDSNKVIKKPDPNAAKRPQDHPDYQDLRFDGYTLEETEFIIKNGGRAALTDPYVKQAIDSKREEAAKAKRTEDGTPSQDGRSPIYKKYTEEELRAMPLKELEKILPHSDR